MSESTTPESGDNFDRLLTHRVEVSEFVNSFTSERVQRKAFEAIVRSLGLGTGPTAGSAEQDPPPLRLIKDDEQGETPPPADREEEGEGASEQPAPTRRKRSAKRSFTVPKGLNWAPEEHPSLEEFVKDKQPRNNHEKNLVACHYLSNMMGLTVDTEHVLAVYQAAGWDAPAHPHTSLQGTASQFAWIDTADMKAIKVVWQGENYLSSKMPGEAKKKTG